MIYLAVGLAGVLGAWSRYALGLLLGDWLGTSFPWGTLLINGTGCLVLGWFLVVAGRKTGISPVWRAAIGTGFIGSYTTFSTFSVETVSMFRMGEPGKAVIYILLSMWGGLALAWAGRRLAVNGNLTRPGGTG